MPRARELASRDDAILAQARSSFVATLQAIERSDAAPRRACVIAKVPYLVA
jgi:hypothetical protein